MLRHFLAAFAILTYGQAAIAEETATASDVAVQATVSACAKCDDAKCSKAETAEAKKCDGDKCAKSADGKCSTCDGSKCKKCEAEKCAKCERGQCTKSDATNCVKCEGGKCADCKGGDCATCDGEKCCDKLAIAKCAETGCSACESCKTGNDSGVKNALLEQKLAQIAQLQSEVCQLEAELGKGQQILVRVQMVEVSLSKLRRMGCDFSTSGGDYFTVKDLAGLEKVNTVVQSNYTPETQPKDQPKHLSNFIDWLKENNVAKEIACPTVVTMNGRPAHLRVGTEIPVSMSGAKDAPIEFQQAGTQLDILPISLPDNRVRVEVRRISEVDDSRSLRVNGQMLPAFKVRQCDTAVVSKFGEPTVLNGMVEERHTTIKRESGKTETEIQQVALMLVVTPELVETLPTAQRPGSQTITR